MENKLSTACGLVQINFPQEYYTWLTFYANTKTSIWSFSITYLASLSGSGSWHGVRQQGPFSYKRFPYNGNIIYIYKHILQMPKNGCSPPDIHSENPLPRTMNWSYFLWKLSVSTIKTPGWLEWSALRSFSTDCMNKQMSGDIKLEFSLRLAFCRSNGTVGLHDTFIHHHQPAPKFRQ